MSQLLEGTRIPVWNIGRNDPGSIYVIESLGRYKIGKTTDATARLRAAKTWLPDMQLKGCKPFWNVTVLERQLHIGFARCWYAGEWFNFENEEDRDLLLDGFLAFSDSDRDRNSIDFIYWMSGDGMAEFVRERHQQRLSIPKFLAQESLSKKSV